MPVKSSIIVALDDLDQKKKTMVQKIAECKDLIIGIFDHNYSHQEYSAALLEAAHTSYLVNLSTGIIRTTLNRV